MDLRGAVNIDSWIKVLQEISGFFNQRPLPEWVDADLTLDNEDELPEQGDEDKLLGQEDRLLEQGNEDKLPGE